MTTIEQLQAALEHLALALNLLDQGGANITAAQVDGAIACLRTEVMSGTIGGLDFSELDRIVDQVYAQPLGLDPMLTRLS